MKNLCTVLLLLLPLASWADELDIYKGDPKPVPARIMLVLDNSLSMSETLTNDLRFQDGSDFNCLNSDGSENGATKDRKMCVLKRTLTTLLSSETVWPNNFEIGLATYYADGSIYGGVRSAKILADIQKLDNIKTGELETQREKLLRLVKGLKLSVYTPLLSSYLDVSEYLQGGTALNRGAGHNPVVWKDVDEDGDPTSGAYNVGMSIDNTKTCGVSNNHVVFLTDGLSFMEVLGDFAEGEVPPNDADGRVTLYERVQQFVARNAKPQTQPHPTGQCNSGIHSDGKFSTERTIDDEGRAPEFNDTEDSDIDNDSEEAKTAQEVRVFDCIDAVAQSLADSGIKTHTIAFSLTSEVERESDSEDNFKDRQNNQVMIGVAVDRLEKWATKVGGTGVAVNSEEGLQNAFKSISGAVEQTASFTAVVPGVGINQANRFTFLDDLYFSTFKPTDRAFWYGNLKKYKLGRKSDLPVVVDSNDRDIDSDPSPDGDGFIDPAVKSYWFNSSANNGATADGDNVVLGGAATRIQEPNSRKLFTVVNDDIHPITSNADTSVLSMISSNNEKASQVLAWLRGEDASDKNEWDRLTEGKTTKSIRTLYGAPIHSRPVVVNYQSTKNGVLLVGERQDEQQNLVFVSTNDGKLYAVDGSDKQSDGGGLEQLAFVPEELLQYNGSTKSVMENLYDAARNNASGDPIYGLDSTWTVWRQDSDKDGNITDGVSKDFVFLYGGMRRGGRNYYGLDMTAANKSSPEMDKLFVLKGGEVGSDFERMGQTWSEPVLALIQFNGKPMVVMIVGGGYDPVYDDGGRPGSGTPMGAQIYMVAAHDRGTIKAGDVLWWASNSGDGLNRLDVDDLKYSIPSTIKPLDVDGDGFLDLFYVGDMGGQLLRFDINKDNQGAGDLIANSDSVVVAKLGVAGESEGASDGTLDENDRRFYFPPSVALMEDDKGRYIGVAIGSGQLTKPKDKDVNERFYFIRDYRALDDDSELAPAIFSTDLTLTSEKMMGSPLIVNGSAFFSTYYWDDAAVPVNQCVPQYGLAALYQYSPGQAAVVKITDKQPQTLAGNIVSLLQLVPGKDQDGKLDPTKDRMDLVGLGGAGAFDLPDIDLGNIRKTRWSQCRTDTCE